MALITTYGIQIILDIIDEALVKGNTKQAVLEMIYDFADGRDGVLGTADDRLSEDQVELLVHLIQDGTIQRLVEKMYKSSWGQKIMKFLFPFCYV